jgi:hypothetical protein
VRDARAFSFHFLAHNTAPYGLFALELSTLNFACLAPICGCTRDVANLELADHRFGEHFCLMPFRSNIKKLERNLGGRLRSGLTTLVLD